MRYTSDLTDAEWQLIDYCFPKPAKTGRPREHAFRELVNAIFYPKFLFLAIGVSIVTYSFATGCPGLLEVLLSGHDSPGVA